MAAQLGETYGIVGLFVAAFLAASLLPFPVEAAVPIAVSLGHSTVAIVLAGAVGGYLGSLLNYGLAQRGTTWWERRNPETPTMVRAREAFQRWGSPLLLLSWLPFVGEALTVAAGVANVRLWVFSLWTVVGRVVRMYALVRVSWWLL